MVGLSLFLIIIWSVCQSQSCRLSMRNNHSRFEFGDSRRNRFSGIFLSVKWTKNVNRYNRFVLDIFALALVSVSRLHILRIHSAGFVLVYCRLVADLQNFGCFHYWHCNLSLRWKTREVRNCTYSPTRCPFQQSAVSLVSAKLSSEHSDSARFA